MTLSKWCLYSPRVPIRFGHPLPTNPLGDRTLRSITLLLAVSCISALAQYGGMSGTGTTSGPYTAPKGGYGSGQAIGIGLGAAAPRVAKAADVEAFPQQ